MRPCCCSLVLYIWTLLLLDSVFWLCCISLMHTEDGVFPARLIRNRIDGDMQGRYFGIFSRGDLIILSEAHDTYGRGGPHFLGRFPLHELHSSSKTRLGKTQEWRKRRQQCLYPLLMRTSRVAQRVREKGQPGDRGYRGHLPPCF